MKYIFLFLLISNLSFAQINNNRHLSNSLEKIDEKVVLNTDRNLYISGEKIWFKAFCSNSEETRQTNISNVLYVELYNNSREFIVKRKFNILDGSAFGSIDIPSEFLSGNYFLRAYTQFFKNQPLSNYFTSLITVVNPNIALEESNDTIIQPLLEEGINNLIIKNKQDSIIKFSAFYHKNKSIQINISTEKKSYSQRELIQLNIEPSINSSDHIAMDLSVSVVKKGTIYKPDVLFKYIMESPLLIESYLQDIEFTHSLTDEQINTLMIIYSNMVSQGSSKDMFKKNTSIMQLVPETRNESISGIIYNKANNLPLPKTFIFLSSFAPNQLHIYKSQQNGEFIFSPKHLVDHQKIFLCSPSILGNEVGFRLNNDFSSKFPVINDIPLSIDTSQHAFLEEMYVNMQAGEIFRAKTSTKQLAEITNPFNFWTPTVSVAIDDYVKTATLEIFLREIVPDLMVKKRKGQYSLTLFDYDQDRFIDDPLIMVDNIPVFNVNYLMDIPLTSVEKIDLHLGSRFMGRYMLNGIVVLSTKSHNYGGIKLPEGSTMFEYHAISASFGFNPPVYDTEEKKSSRLADFRNLLYWNPNFSLTDDKASLSFYTSDHCSEYEVIIKGYTNDGRKCYGKTSFKVE